MKPKLSKRNKDMSHDMDLGKIKYLYRECCLAGGKTALSAESGMAAGAANTTVLGGEEGAEMGRAALAGIGGAGSRRYPGSWSDGEGTEGKDKTWHRNRRKLLREDIS